MSLPPFRRAVRTTSVVAAVTVAVGLAATPATAATTSITVTTDLSSSQGSLSHVADGFLHGLSGTKPTEQVVDQVGVRALRAAPLYLDGNTFTYSRGGNPAFLSQGTWTRVSARNPTIVGNLAYNTSNVPGKTSSSNPTYFPGDGGDWTTWTGIIHKLVTESESEGFRGAYSVWNEPNNEFKDHGGFTRFLDAYKYAYQQIRTDSPDAKIVGPEINQYNYAQLQQFLTYAKNNNVLPDVLDWHALVLTSAEIAAIPSNVAQIKSWMSSNGISIPKIYITEFGACDPANRPSDTGAYIPALEAAGIDAAMKANWPACSGFATSGDLPSAATADGTALTSVGQVFKAYNQMSGTRTAVNSADSQIVPFGALDTTRNAAWLMVSNNDTTTAPQTVSASIANIPSGLISGGKVHLRLEAITNSDADASTPAVISDADATTDGTSVSFSADLDQYEVVVAKLTPPTGPSVVQPTFVQTDDASTAVTYSSGWTAANDASAYDNTKHSTGNADATASISFTGSAVRVYTKKGPDNGQYEVYIDGASTPAATVDAYSSTVRYQQVTYATNSLSGGQHTIRLRVTGQKNAASSGPFIGLDKFETKG